MIPNTNNYLPTPPSVTAHIDCTGQFKCCQCIDGRGAALSHRAYCLHPNEPITASCRDDDAETCEAFRRRHA